MHTKFVGIVAVILACCSFAHASTTWTGAGGDGRWDNPANWSSGLPVGGGDSSARTFIDGIGNTVLIDAATNAVASRLLISDAGGSTDNTINMTGGTLTTSASTSGERNWHLGAQGTATFNLSGGVVNVDGQIRMGVDNVTTAQGILNINGGSFSTTGPIIMGFGSASTLTQQLNMTAGTLSASQLFVNDNIPSFGTPAAVVDMSGGMMTVGNLAVPTNYGLNGLNGHFQLDGGTVTVTNASTGGKQNQPAGFRLANGPGEGGQIGNTVTGTMDITNGTLLLTGDATSLVSEYINAGVLTGFGSPVNVIYDFNNTNAGFTTIKAIVGGTTDTTWTGSGDGTNWTSAGNWNSGVPTALVSAHINGSPTVQIGTGVNAAALKLALAEASASDNVTLNVNNGTLSLGTSNPLVIGAKGRATLNLSNGATLTSGSLQLGVNNGEASARGTVSVASSTLNVNGSIRLGVGDSTTQIQQLTISGTSNVTASGLAVAETAGSVGQVTVSGGTLAIGGGTTALGGSGNGTLTINGGAVTLGGNLALGATAGAAAAKGTLTISSGSLSMPGRTLLMGGSSSTTEVQTLNMSGGTLSAARLFVDDNVPSTGGPMAVVNMTGGTMTLGDLAIPTNWGLNGLDGHFDLHGGIVIVNNASTGSAAASPSGFRIANGLDPLGMLNTVSGSMDITSGALLLSGDRTTLIQDYLNAGVLTGSAGPILFDFNLTNPGYTTVHTAAFNGSISTIWTGAGDALNWNVAGNWNNGVPDSGKIVGIGGNATVQVATGVTAAASSMVLAAGASTDNVTLNVNGGSLTVGGGFPLGTKGRATLNVTNSGTVTASGDLSLGNTDGETNSRGIVTVNVGTLNVGAIRLGVGNATTQSQDFTLTAGTVTAPGTMTLAEQPGTIGNMLINGGTLTVGPTRVGAKGTGTLTINAGTVSINPTGSATGVSLRVGGTSAPDPGEVDAKGTVNITGGALTVQGRILLGAARHATAVQTMNMSGGTLTAGALFISDEADDVAVFNMTGGVVSLGDLAIPTNFGEANLNGTFNLHGGTVTVNNASPGGTATTPAGFRILNGDNGGPNTVHGKMDITSGTLKLFGDTLAVINPYIVTDKSILAFGGTGIVLRDTTTNPGFTTVTAAILGDANRDGLVNIFDINLISSNWNTGGPTADVNGDSIVNIFDINAVSSHWLQTNPDGPTAGVPAANAVPEPATVVSLAIGALLLGLRFHRKV